MKASFVIKEMVYNTICKDKLIYVDEDGASVQKIIDYIKCVPMSEDIQVHCTDGCVYMANSYESFDFEVNNKLQWKKANKKQIAASKKNL